MKLKALNDNSIDINGTSLQGYITMTRRSLNKAFGIVERNEYADKVQSTITRSTKTLTSMLCIDGTSVAIHHWLLPVSTQHSTIVAH
jgi:hypothetical protein